MYVNCLNCGSSFDLRKKSSYTEKYCGYPCKEEHKRKKKHDAQMLKAAQSQAKAAKSQPIQQSSSSGSGMGDAAKDLAVGAGATVAMAAGGLAVGAGKALIDRVLESNKNHKIKLEEIQALEIPTDPKELRRMFFHLSGKVNWNLNNNSKNAQSFNNAVTRKLESITRYWKLEGIDDPNYQQILQSFEEELQRLDKEDKKRWIVLGASFAVILLLWIIMMLSVPK